MINPYAEQEIAYYRCLMCGTHWSQVDVEGSFKLLSSKCPKCKKSREKPFFRGQVPVPPVPADNVQLPPMPLPYFQLLVHEHMRAAGWSYWTPPQIVNQMTSEVGELADAVNALFGPKPPKPGDTVDDTLELGDVLYAVVCYANVRGINLEDALKQTIEKFFNRDKKRYKKKGKKKR